MAFCKNCGAELEEGAKFCPSCGKSTTEEAPKAEESFADKVAGLNNTPDTTTEYDPKDIEDNKVMALLAYIGILFLVPLLAAKDSKFAKFHTNQGIVLFIAVIILGVVMAIPILGWIVGAVGGVITLVLAIIGIVNAVQGRAKELPIIGKFKILK